MKQNSQTSSPEIPFETFRQSVLEDYRIGQLSRQASLLGRKEVLTGKAKFGIFGDGKEVAQLAMARVFRPGDFRSGYYRDQTFMFALGELTVQQFFAQLYAHPDIEKDPQSAGRQMNGHYSTQTIGPDGEWRNLAELHNSSADVSPTAAQMLRLVGLGYASKLFRTNPELAQYPHLSTNGNEVALGTIGNASTAEGHFWEAVNACGVLMAPVAISIWDDGYGISVPNEYQITKQNLSELLSGFAYDEEKKQGYRIYTVNGWNYPALMKAYEEGIALVREEHVPAIFHITEMTQPQGHSTSGSHERYKTKERLDWEDEFDPLLKMRQWVEANGLATAEELDAIEEEAKKQARQEQKAAWEDFLGELKAERAELAQLIQAHAAESAQREQLTELAGSLQRTLDNDRRFVLKTAWQAMLLTKDESQLPTFQALAEWHRRQQSQNADRYNTKLYSGRALEVEPVEPQYSNESPVLDGREVLLNFFDKALARDPRLFIFGEDVGRIGDVNQGLAGMQEKYGPLRVTDTGIREATIAGQGIGAAMRGLRPIAEIQYLDYLLYCLQILSDDLSTLYYRTAGRQKAPLIVRTRGHRLEGIWHSGSPMGAIVNACRGMYVCVPRNMTQAVGFYNTLLAADEPGLVIERLNAYRLKERLPANLEDMKVPLGVPEVLRYGNDITIVTYGACTDIAIDATEKLEQIGIDVEVIDVQTLLPFDIHHRIGESVRKTNRVIFLDEDVPGGGTAYMLQQALEHQNIYRWLDSPPITLAAKPHRPAYGTDGDYFSKPNAEDVFRACYALMHEADPGEFGMFW